MPKSTPPPLTLDLLRSRNTKVRMPCSLAEFLLTQPRKDVAVVFQAIRDETIQASAIHGALEDRGWKGHPQIVRRHRRVTCASCEKKLGFRLGDPQ